jgi:cell division ATPase FtsA
MVIPQNFIVDNETGLKSPIGICGRRLEANFHIVIVRLQQPRISKNVSGGQIFQLRSHS